MSGIIDVWGAALDLIHITTPKQKHLHRNDSFNHRDSQNQGSCAQPAVRLTCPCLLCCEKLFFSV